MRPGTVLTPLLEEGGELRRAYHEHEPLLLKSAVPVTGLPTCAELSSMLDASLLRWPYFAVFQDGVRPERSEIVAHRRVGGRTLDGFMDGSGVRRQLDAGATLKLSQVEDWHTDVRHHVDELAAGFPAAVTSFLFLTPYGKRGMRPHRDGSRVIVIQLEGAKEWHLYGSGRAERPDAGLDVDPATETAQFLLEPGDVLYLPHACGHAADTVDGMSLHLTFTVAEPTPQELAAAYLRAWRSSVPADLDASELLANLGTFVEQADPRAVLAATTAAAQNRDGS